MHFALEKKKAKFSSMVHRKMQSWQVREHEIEQSASITRTTYAHFLWWIKYHLTSFALRFFFPFLGHANRENILKDGVTQA